MMPTFKSSAYFSAALQSSLRFQPSFNSTTNTGSSVGLVETDPTIPAWAKRATPPTPEEIGALANTAIRYQTTAQWAVDPLYVPYKGQICIYSDYETVTDEEGNVTNYIAVKIGDGKAYLVDLPYLSADTAQALFAHIQDTTVHITMEEREKWNHKIDCQDTVSGETLNIFR